MTTLLEIKNLSVNIATDQGDVHAVRDVSLSLEPGETLAIVGESGCGKSVFCKSILGILPVRAEAVSYTHLSVAEDLKSRTGDIPQDKIPTAYCGAVSFKGAHGIEGTEAGYPPFSALGITNVADETGKKGAFDVDLEQILKWNADYLFLDAGNLKLVKDDYAVRPDFYNELKAVQDKKVYSQVAYRFNGTRCV